MLCPGSHLFTLSTLCLGYPIHTYAFYSNVSIIFNVVCLCQWLSNLPLKLWKALQKCCTSQYIPSFHFKLIFLLYLLSCEHHYPCSTQKSWHPLAFLLFFNPKFYLVCTWVYMSLFCSVLSTPLLSRPSTAISSFLSCNSSLLVPLFPGLDHLVHFPWQERCIKLS